jgi:hypothetical protein
VRLWRDGQHSIIVASPERRSAPSLALELDKGLPP